ncbi:MAG: hypothetical protein JWO36_5734 [Myxococcales bacterium]|nr:hypothetical protein [Myxococcales bacterium]
MPNLMPTDIKPEVLAVLRAAATGRGEVPRFLTSYQILARLSEPTRTRLMAERGNAGAGGGQNFGPATVVAKAGELLKGDQLVRIEYWDTGGVTFSIAGQPDAPASFAICAIFQAIPEE